MTASDTDDVTRRAGEINISRAEKDRPLAYLHRPQTRERATEMNQATAVNPHAILIIALLITAFIMLFWRAVIKFLIALIATGIVLTIAFTAITIYQRA
jgi:hypothetical protein